ncbi:unnamed protein product, partial [Rotaria sordida]
MGNFVFAPLLHRRSKLIINGNTDETSMNSQSSTAEYKDYRVSYDVTSNIESYPWYDIKNRKKHKSQTNCIRTTRYNILTFIPKNLFEQFHRVANIYFAVLIGLNWVPMINALAKTVAFIPLTVILVITGVKDLVEDLKRWRSDAKINKQLTEVYDKTSRTFVQCKWQDLSVGSIVRIHADQTVPADILLLSSTSYESTCYLDTAAIDGETNLKQKIIPSCFLNISKPEETKFELQCDQPNEDIYHFHVVLQILNESRILTSRTFVQCKWQDLSVGSIVRIHADQTVPADILLLSSASYESTCYLDTAAIDGETNLKQKIIPSCFLNISKPEETKF